MQKRGDDSILVGATRRFSDKACHFKQVIYGALRWRSLSGC
jgi:hypothetical protein